MPDNQPSTARSVLRFIFLILGASGAYTIWREYFENDYLADSIDAGNWSMLLVVLIMMSLVGLCFFAWSALGGQQAESGLDGDALTDDPTLHRIRIDLVDGETEELNDLTVTLDGQMVLGLIRVCREQDRSGFERPTPERIDQLMQLTQGDESAAHYLHNMAQAFSDRRLLSVLTNGAVQIAPSVESLAAEITQPIQEHYPEFFSQCPPERNEFIVCWASRLVMTSDRMVIFGDLPTADPIRILPLDEIVGLQA